MFSKNKEDRVGNARRLIEITSEKLEANPVTNQFCPPKGEVANTLTLILTLIAIFITANTVLGPIAAVGGTIFALLVLIALALIGGKAVLGFCWALKRVSNGAIDLKLPPLLGMLIVGIILKNVPYNFGQFGRAECNVFDSIHDLDVELEDTDLEHTPFKRRRRSVIPNDIYHHEGWIEVDHLDFLTREIRSAKIETSKVLSVDQNTTEDNNCHKRYIGHDMDPQISRTLRLICLTVILLMAGLELDPAALMKLSGMVVRATFIPCFVEAVVVAVLSKYLLGFPWTVGFMLGFVLAAVSPAVIIPCLMSLSNHGYGVKKGIPTLVIAACSADDVVAISGFGIFLGITSITLDKITYQYNRME